MNLGEYEYHRNEGDRDWWQVGIRRCTLGMTALPPGRSLDLGSGSGFFVRDLTRAGWNAQGIELNPTSVELAAQIGIPGKILTGRIQECIKKLTEPFDLLTCLDVLSHREIDELEILTLARAHLRPGGHLVLRLPAYRALYGEHDAYVHQTHRYDRSDVYRLAHATGFEVERVSYACFFLFPLFLAHIAFERGMELLRPTKKSELKSANHRQPQIVNALFLGLLRFEALLIGRGLSLPFGSSLLAVLRKPK